KESAVAGYSRLPIMFEENRGQLPEATKFQAVGAGYRLSLQSAAAVLDLSPSISASTTLKLQLLGGNTTAKISGRKELVTKSFYYVGRKAKEWHRAVPNYAEVRYENVYPSTDVVYYGTQGRLEYDFVVNPGGDPGLLKLHVSSAKELYVDGSGDAVIATGSGNVRLKRPIVYQEVGKQRHEIPASYLLENGNQLRF